MAMESLNPDFEIFSSLRYDPALLNSKSNTVCCRHATSFYMLPYHRDRMLAAARFFDWQDAISALSSLEHFEDQLLTAVKSYNIKNNLNDNPLKVRVSIAKASSTKLLVQLSPVSPVSLDVLFPSSLPPDGTQDLWSVYVYREALTPDAHTTFKTTQRAMYDQARNKFKLGGKTVPTEEVLLLDLEGNLLEGSLTSVYFKQEGKWITPPAGLDKYSNGEEKWRGGQQGTTRRWATETQLCTEGSVPISVLQEGDICVVSNGVRGFIEGRIVSLSTDPS